MYIRIIAVGKLKHKNFLSLAQDYIARLGHWHLEIIELKESKLDDVAKRTERDAFNINMHLKDDYYNVVLDAIGDEMNSEKFSNFMQKKKDTGDKICFIIGGAYGLSEDFKNKMDKRLSFGKMTFTHQFVRILLLEQIYRASTIMSGKGYHY
jgi:23S rRNA (pseudouridine1915-N3)-methyltransferase